MPDRYSTANSAQRESWNLAQYALKHNRMVLIDSINQITGSPCYAMAAMQAEFIRGQMDPGEMIDYARACCEIIFSIKAPMPSPADETKQR